MKNNQHIITPINILPVVDFAFLFTLVSILIAISRYNYLLFHSLIEIAIATIGFLTFAFTWHLRRFDLGILLILGILLGCSAFMGVFHMLTYKGMVVFNVGPNLPTQLWLASRYFFSVILLVAMLFRGIKVHANLLLVSLCLSTVLLATLVFYGAFPDCFDPATGQTRFKIISEYVISGFLVTSMVLFWRTRSTYPSVVSWLIMTFFGFSILTELVFTSYFGVYDLSNLFGHVFHLVASYFLYKAIVVTGLENPYDLMFKNLNDAVRARDEFISLASHELKTPLTPLKMQIQMFQRELLKRSPDGDLDERSKKILSTTNQQLDRLNQLIDGMLDVSRLNTGRFEIFKEKIDLSVLISELVKRQEPMLATTTSAIELSLMSIEAEVDRMRIEQVVTNLLTNALKYAPGSKITIGLEKTAEGRAVIWVRDEGPGISKEFQSKIFDRYERGVSKSSEGGLGLGLYISRQIIENHGGTLWLESEPSKGSKFFVVL